MRAGREAGLYARRIKRPLDVVCALTGLLVLSPVLVVVAGLVRVRLGSPVLFCQERPGKNGVGFKLWKFRTMTDARDENGDLLPDCQRLTTLGRRLRAASLDELPELWNILRGDMSLVGPRPLLSSYLPWYTEEEQHRHDVRPGLTGLAQVSGRNAVDWDERLALDIRYVRQISLRMDLEILWRTAGQVISGAGVAEDTRQEEGNLAQIRSARAMPGGKKI